MLQISTLSSLSKLSHSYKSDYDLDITWQREVPDNFVHCGLQIDNIKSESDEDIPLIELNNLLDSDIDISQGKKIIKQKRIKPTCKTDLKYYSICKMDENEMLDSQVKRKMLAVYVDAAFKCESCVELFKSQIDLDTHNINLHVKSENHTQCDKCLAYINVSELSSHKDDHYNKYSCRLCEHVSYTSEDMLRHLKTGHSVKNLSLQRRKGQKKARTVLNPGSKPRRNQAMLDQRTPYGYLCGECNKYFDNKNQRWKHIQRFHREGFKCSTCDKKFAFKNNLNRHELLHKGPPPREECPICNKMIRVDLLRIHSRIHSNRQKYSCVECQKNFVSRASYEHHLKYTQVHSLIDIHKYKCGVCDKGYRSRGELRDHVNYQHMARTQHKCPVCGKAMATRRCITRHVRRAHHGIKEARDKICQQCGKTFRDKKGLREHEFIHTGERPLSCEICGCTFRQNASLYTHKKRVHKIYPQRKHVEILDTANTEQ